MQVELSISANSPEQAAVLLRQNKALLVRGALDPEVARRFGRAWDAGYDAHMAELDGTTDGAARRLLIDRHYADLHERADLPPYELLRQIARSSAFKIVHAYCGTPTVLATWNHLVHARAMRGRSEALRFHQDGGAGGDLYIRAWVLVHPESAGDNAAGLQLLPVPGESHIYPFDPGGRYDGPASTIEAIDKLRDEQAPWTPIVRLGDVLLFIGDCLHASHWPEIVSERRRWAFEVTFMRGTAVVIDEFGRDFCVFDERGIQYPSRATLGAWGTGPSREGLVLL